MPAPRRISADWLLTGTGHIIPQGALLTDSVGRILAAGHADTVPRSPLIPEEHFSRAVLLPGLINTHTHLELTGLEGQAPEADFFDWIRTVIRLKAGRGLASVLQFSEEGLRQSFASGVTTVADTGDSEGPARAIASLGGRGIAYLEVFGPDPRDAVKNLEDFKGRVRKLRELESGRLRIGVSPHAPYSVSGALYRAVAEFAREENLPLAVHLAESPAETELLQSGTGAFAQNWMQRGIPLPAEGLSPVAWLDHFGVLTSKTLCIHVVQVDGNDIGRLASHRCGVAHCPRSNRRHGHGDAPLRALLDAGLSIGVGTDSAISVYPPDLMKEARMAQELAHLTPPEALDLVTLGAARALGLQDEIGTLEIGKWADYTVLKVPPSTSEAELAAVVLGRDLDDVLLTCIEGTEVYRRVGE
jgi:5-methylthioadenosine/S-adenosylhomocysteine deaminase